MSEKNKREIREILLAAKCKWKELVVPILVFASLFLCGKCYGQSVYVGIGSNFRMSDSKQMTKVSVGAETGLTRHYKVGCELNYLPGDVSRGSVLVFNAVGSEIDMFGLWVKGMAGVEHAFTDAETDHSYVDYGVGVVVTCKLRQMGLFVENSMTWNTYSAHISPTAERGWYGIRCGVLIPLQ